MSMKKLLLFVCFLLIIPIAFSADFTYTLDGESSINAGDSGEFVASIKNMGSSNWFSVSILGTPETQSWYTVEKTSTKINNLATEDIKIWFTPPKKPRSSRGASLRQATKLPSTRL